MNLSDWIIFFWDSSHCSLRTSTNEVGVFNSLVKLLFMKLNQENIDNLQETVDGDENLIPIQDIDTRNYLYPDGHRMTPQMRWFKGSRGRGFKSDMAA